VLNHWQDNQWVARLAGHRARVRQEAVSASQAEMIAADKAIEYAVLIAEAYKIYLQAKERKVTFSNITSYY